MGSDLFGQYLEFSVKFTKKPATITALLT